jgi:hypothetical protein
LADILDELPPTPKSPPPSGGTRLEVSSVSSAGVSRRPSTKGRRSQQEEEQNARLRTLLRNTSDRLEYETTRADEAVARATYAENQALERFTRLKEFESRNTQITSELQRSQREAETYMVRLEDAQREVSRLHDELRSLREQRDSAEDRARHANRIAEDWYDRFENYKAREEGRIEGLRRGWVKKMDELSSSLYNDGYNDGYEHGTKDGFDHGVRKGRPSASPDPRSIPIPRSVQGSSIGDDRDSQCLSPYERRFQVVPDEDETVSWYPIFVALTNNCSNAQKSQWTRRWAKDVYQSTSPIPFGRR